MSSSSAVATATTARNRLPPAQNATPSKAPSTPTADSPGNWTHPRLAEITRRQAKNVFGENNIKVILYNVLALAVYLGLCSALLRYVPFQVIPQEFLRFQDAGYWVVRLLPLLPLFNILTAFLPLLRGPDAMTDIPLTPGQRRLLGLPPSTAPLTPNSVFSTPPRYSRTPSLAGSPAGTGTGYASSPLSGRESPASDRRRSSAPFSPSDRRNSPFSPMAANPLLHKAIGNIPGKSSFGSASPSSLLASTASGVFDGPSTPSPLAAKRSSVTLNNRFLYERERERSRWVSSTGSVMQKY